MNVWSTANPDSSIELLPYHSVWKLLLYIYLTITYLQTTFFYSTTHMKKHKSQGLIFPGCLFYCRKAGVALKTPLECVYLLTLSGVHSIMLNQWSSSDRTNAHNLEAIIESRSPAHTYNLTDTPTNTDSHTHTQTRSSKGVLCICNCVSVSVM